MESTLAILGVFFVPATMVILIVWFRNAKKTKRYQIQADLAAKALEKGQPIPADLFVEPIKKQNPLNTGIICISAGVGVALMCCLMALSLGNIDKDAYHSLMSVTSVGVIPFFVGVGFLIIYFIEKKKATSENAK